MSSSILIGKQGSDYILIIWNINRINAIDTSQQNDLFKHIPVIMLSSEDSTSERIKLLEVGAADYIVKPFNPMELKIRIKKII